MTRLSKLLFVLGVCVGLAVGVYLSTPTDKITGATVIASPCGLLMITTTHADGTIRDYPEYPGNEFLRALEALPQDALKVVPVPCPFGTLLPNHYEANKNQENLAQTLGQDASRVGPAA